MTWKNGRVVKSGDLTTIENLDGTVMSLNPPSPYSFTAMPQGTAGQYEVVAIDGGAISWNPTGKEPVVYGFKATDPNNPGCCAITTEPL